MKRFAAFLLTVPLLLSGCGAASQTTETKSVTETVPVSMESIPVSQPAEKPIVPEETTASTEYVPSTPETLPREEAAPVETQPQNPESVPPETQPAPTKPIEPAPTVPEPTEPKPTQPEPTQPAPPSNPKPSYRPTSSATCRDTGSNEIWEDPAKNQKDYYEETDPERTNYLAFLQEEGNPYYFWIMEEDMRMYLGRTYGIPFYTSYEHMLECTWECSDPSVATVNQVGFVVPLKAGEVVITVSRVNPETQETSSRTCRIRVEEKPVYTFAQLEEKARQEAKEIAAYINTFPLNNDLERIAAAATVINTYVAKGTSTSAVPGYNQPFGTLITGYSSCAGSTRALGLVLEYMGFSWYHMGENQWSHQWCVVYDVDGQTAFADGSAYGIAGYGERAEDGSNWMCYRNGSLQPFS